jgi:glutamine synthetase
MTKKKDSPAAELRRLFRKYPETQTLELLIPDVCGILKGKRIRRRDFEKALTEPFWFCGGTVLLTALGEIVDGLPGAGDGDPDVPCRFVPGSLAPVPWAGRPMAQGLFRMYETDGRPHFADPRAVLERALAPLRKMGLTVVMATELEFYLLRRNTDQPAPRAPRIPGIGRRQRGAQVYHPDDLNAVQPFLDDVYDFCSAQGIPADTVISEYGPGQFEINLLHVDDPVLACDHAVLLKRAVKAAAIKNGYVACFMAKPFADLSGNGLHIHMSLVDRHGRNYFSHGRENLALPPFSARLRHAVGGLLKTMPEATAIFAPNANSYRRLLPENFAPVDLNWGYNHRDVAIRIPQSDAKNLRFEHRVAGADANPYLVTAAVAAGVHYGLKNKCDPGPMVRERERLRLKTRIPDRWEAALDKFSRSKILPGYLGREYCRCYEVNRRAESIQFHNTISPLDFDWYLRSV